MKMSAAHPFTHVPARQPAALVHARTRYARQKYNSGMTHQTSPCNSIHWEWDQGWGWIDFLRILPSFRRLRRLPSVLPLRPGPEGPLRRRRRLQEIGRGIASSPQKHALESPGAREIRVVLHSYACCAASGEDSAGETERALLRARRDSCVRRLRLLAAASRRDAPGGPRLPSVRPSGWMGGWMAPWRGPPDGPSPPQTGTSQY